MEITFDSVYERDMDFFLMRKIADDESFLKEFFLKPLNRNYENSKVSVEKISHSVVTKDGESDIEVILSIDGKQVALLIEDKIDARAMEEQYQRYRKRGKEAVERGDYTDFYVFIVAPEKYLKGNSEAKKYSHTIPYEEIPLANDYENALMDRALKKIAGGFNIPRDKTVTAFWDRLYDYLDENYPGVFKVQGSRGLERSGEPGQWITISCNRQFTVEIKSDRGFADLEIHNYADKFQQFCKDNKDLIDDKQLYIRTASKSLAIRKYVPCIDFTQSFEAQEEVLKEAFDAAKELQDLIKDIKI